MTERTPSGERPAGLYPMRVMEQLTGLSRRQIRYYEEQGLLAPERSDGGHRLYSAEELDRLMVIKSLMERGFRTISEVKRCLKSDLRLSVPSNRHPTNQTTSRIVSQAGKRPAYPLESDAENYFQRHKRWPQG